MERRSPIRGRGERNSYRFESCPDCKIKDMFRTLNYIWKLFWKRPSRRVFFIFFRMLKTEIKCLMLTGYSTDELLN